MVWYLHEASTNIATDNVSMTMSVAKVVRSMERSDLLLSSARSLEIESLITTGFGRVLEELEYGPVIDPGEVRELYENFCGDQHRQLPFEHRQELEACEREFEREIFERTDLKAVAYVDTGIWGFQRGKTAMLTPSKKGNLSLQAAVTLKSTEKGTILWQDEKNVSFLKRKFGHKKLTVDMLLSDDLRLFQSTLEELVITASRELVRKFDGS